MRRQLRYNLVMCCFSGRVEEVADTRIFACGARQDRQVLIYEMKVSVDQPVAMVLPIPTPTRSFEDAVRFVSLEAYPEIFDDLAKAFPPPPPPLPASLLPLERAAGYTRLAVHHVGAFVASFVPSLDDFDRIDPLFRIRTILFECIPDYVGWGYVVFQLATTAHRLTRIHPMAFEFPTRYPDRLFFPTLHIHDGAVNPLARFAHTLYVQGKDPESWTRASSLGGFVDPRRAADLINVGAPAWRTEIHGEQLNCDTWV